MSKLQFPFQEVTDIQVTLGQINNIKELVKATPEEFHNRRNEWNHLAETLFYKGGTLGGETNYKNPDVSEGQARFIHACLKSWDFKHEHKQAVCGWLLSLMLKEVPEQNNE
jgi:hypothetical protein